MSNLSSPIEEITIEADGPCAIMTLNRPDKRNAMSLRMWETIPQIAQQVADDDSVHALVITGSGGNFCAGADISEFGTTRSTPELANSYRSTVEASEHAVTSLPKPTIAMIDGFCVGGGLEIALSCDFRYLSTRARLGITASKLGIIYGVPATRRLTSIVGAHWAKWVLFSSIIFPADRANQMGLATEVVEPEQLQASTMEFVELLARRAPLTIEGSKQIIEHFTQVASLERPDVQEITDRAISSDFYQSGVAAFQDKTMPREHEQ